MVSKRIAEMNRKDLQDAENFSEAGNTRMAKEIQDRVARRIERNS